MLIHLWLDGTIACQPLDPMVQSTSDQDRVTCPACLNKVAEVTEEEKPSVRPVTFAEAKAGPDGIFYEDVEPTWAKDALMRERAIDAEMRKLMLSRTHVDLDYIRQIRRVADADMFRILDEIASKSGPYLILDSYRKPVETVKISLPDEPEFDPPCSRCKGSGYDPEFHENDPNTGEPLPVECEECRARRWDQENLQNY